MLPAAACVCELAVSFGRAVLKVLAEMDNRGQRFRPEMYGSIRHTESVETLPVLPPGAVIEGDGRNIVLVEQAPGRFEQREVTLGKRAGNLVAILKGLKPGERVVVDGGMLLRPNDSPAPRPAAPAQLLSSFAAFA